MELEDIASNLLEHPFISDAVVLAIDDPAKGKYLAAYYVNNENRAENNSTQFDVSNREFKQFLEKNASLYATGQLHKMCIDSTHGTGQSR